MFTVDRNFWGTGAGTNTPRELAKTNQANKKGRAPKLKASELCLFSRSPLLGRLVKLTRQIIQSKGWVSIDRSMVAALPSTTPRPAHKSSTDDLGPPLCQVDTQESCPTLWAEQQSSRDRDGVRRLSFPEQNRRPNGIVAMTRRDSALEAFRHNPTDGSFAPPLDRVSTCTKCPNLRFLSYWAGLLSQRPVNSRVKLTCLTTV